MEVLSISLPEIRNENIKNMLNILLSKGIMNDMMFENVMFEFEIKNDHPIMFMYRLLWEQRYLRRFISDSSYPNPEKTKLGKKDYVYNVNISLSEVIGFINQITPPIFKPRVKELYNSFDSIMDTLRMYLLEGSPDDTDIGYNTKVLQQTIGWNRFDTLTEYDKRRTDILRKDVSNGIVVDIVASTESVKDIYDGKVSNEQGIEHALVQFMFSCVSRDDLYELAKIITDPDNGISVLNVFVAEDFYYVECMSYTYDSTLNPDIQKIIKDSYSHIFEK